MPEFTVEEDVAAIVERLAKAKPFENLTFNDALKRVLEEHMSLKNMDRDLEWLLAESLGRRPLKKAISPSPQQWVTSVKELKLNKNLNTWKAVCDFLNIETAGDSARRKLRNWVKANRPDWPSVPEV